MSIVCAHNIEDWTEVPYAWDWISLRTDLEDALAWDMDPMDADAWARMGASPWVARRFLDVGVYHEAAEWWLAEGYDPDEVADAYEALPWHQPGGRPTCDLKQWAGEGFELTDAVRYIRAGISIAEAAQIPLGPEVDLLAAFNSAPG